MQYAKYLLGKLSSQRNNLSWAIFYCYFLVILFSVFLYLYKDNLDKWINILICLIVYSAYLIAALFLFKGLRSNGSLYTQKLVEVRQMIDMLIETRDWTIYRNRKIAKSVDRDIVNLITSFDREQNALMSPVRKVFNCYGFLMGLLFIVILLVFLFSVYLCIKVLADKPWMFF